MTHAPASHHSVAKLVERGGFQGRLPKAVRLVEDHSNQKPVGLYEFEVVVGNAAYREGEHFYLTTNQARCAYLQPAFREAC